MARSSPWQVHALACCSRLYQCMTHPVTSRPLRRHPGFIHSAIVQNVAFVL